MKVYALLLFCFILIACNLKVERSASKQDLLPCYNKWELPNSVEYRLPNKIKLYYTLIGSDYQNLKILISDINLSDKNLISSRSEYSSNMNESLLNCLKRKNKKSYIQDIWSDMFLELSPEDNTKEIGRDNYYPNELLISKPNINTFKVWQNTLEIKSFVFNNLGDTNISTIKWKYRNGRYIFDKYTTATEDENMIE